MHTVASHWLQTALMLPLSGLAAAAILAHQQPDLSSVKAVLPPKEPALQNLPSMLVQTSIKQSVPLELSEGEINDYLARKLTSEQKGMSGRFAKLERLLLDFEEGNCRMHLCWEVLGHHMVGTVELTLTRTANDFEIEVKQGAYGRLKVPRALLPPLLPALQELARVCHPEIDALFKLPHIRLAKDKLVLNPKF